MNFWLIGFQDPGTPIMEGIIDLHNYIFFYLILVLFFVTSIFLNIFYYFYYLVNVQEENNVLLHRYTLLAGNKVTHGTFIEIVWTLIPSLILMLIAVPSFALLYSMDEVIAPGLIIRAIGHQWYWSYEYSDYKLSNSSSSLWLGQKNVADEDISIHRPKFDAYMINEAELKEGQKRLLQADYSVVLPIQKHIRVLVSAADVLHSWAVPSLGVKVDAVPGRLNQASIFIKRPGVFYGQCSEICGVNHGFMPITIRAVAPDAFAYWYLNSNK